MRKLVTVVLIESFSYSGTTWINLLLGSHSRAVALGPPDRVVDMFVHGEQDASSACRVHGRQCVFWPRFFAERDRSKNFYTQVAEALKRDVIVINNPLGSGRALADLRHRDVLVKRMTVVRDGRSVMSSYEKYHPRADFLDTLNNWFCPFAENLAFDEQDPDALCVRYEDVVSDQKAFMRRAAEFVGIDYQEKALRYWEFEHHLIRCNPGPLGIIRRYLGHDFSSTDAEKQEERYQRLIKDPTEIKVDQRWEREWGTRDRLLFDGLAGHFNEKWGYSRDTFNWSQIRELEREMRELRPDLLPRLGLGETGAGMIRQRVETIPSRGTEWRSRVIPKRGVHLTARQSGIIGLLLVAAWLASLLGAAVAGAMLF